MKDGREQLEEAIDLLHKGRWIILGCLILGIGAAIAYNQTRSPEYVSTAMVVLDGQTQNGQNGGQSEEDYVRIGTHWGGSISNEIILLNNSQELPRQVAERLRNLEDSDQREAARSLIMTAAGDTAADRAITDRVKQSVEFSSDGSSVIEIAATSSSAEQASLLANLFAEEYVDMTREVSRASLSATREFLNEQLNQRERELRQIEQRIDRYLSTRSTASIEAEATELSQQVATLRTEVDQLETELERRRATVEALQNRLDEIRPGLVDQIASTVDQDIERAHERLAELKAKKQEALANNPELSDEDPQLAELNERIQELRRQIAALAREYVGQVMAEGGGNGSAEEASGLSEVAQIKEQIASHQVAISGIRAEIAALNGSIDQYRSELQTIPGQSLTIGQLRRERDRVNRMYDQLLGYLQQTRMREEAELGYASLIAEAESSGEPVNPRIRHLILGGFFGIVFGLVIAAVRYKFDNRVYQPDVLEEHGVTTVIPNMRKLIANGQGTPELAENGERAPAPHLVSFHKPESAVSEAYRQLRTNLKVDSNDRSTDTMLVTSPGVGEGKTTTACNLAVSFARSGARTLLVDADLRRPQIHDYLGLSLEPGLHQLLNKEGREFYSPNLETGVSNLFALTAGQASGAAGAELISSPRMGQLIEALYERFEVVIFDTPPALVATEAKVLAARLDSALLVVRAGETKEEEFNRAYKELTHSGATIRALVLNGFDMSMAYNYWYRYGGYPTVGSYTDTEA